MLFAWLAVAGILAVSEMLTLTLYLAPFSASALLAAAAAALGFSVLAQVGLFAVLGVLLIAAFRPLARRYASAPALTGPAAMVGSEATALTDIDSRDGRVKAVGGEWSAKSSEPIAAGSQVVVVALDGVVLTVEELS